jgi:hypothetical protein
MDQACQPMESSAWQAWERAITPDSDKAPPPTSAALFMMTIAEVYRTIAITDVLVLCWNDNLDVIHFCIL